MAPPRPELPIDAVLPDVLAALRVGRSLVVEAPPGAGKTTRIPLALLDAGLAGEGLEVLVLQPRRIAARMSAQRVAETIGEPIGRRVGYQVRFESAVSPATRLRFITEGLLSRKLHADPQLRDVGVVILDEFHERHLDGDLGLALVRQLQRGARPDLAIVVMSATLDAAPVQRYLSEGTAPCARITSAGRVHPVTIEHQGATSEAELASGVLRAFKQLLDDDLDGDVLVFLPGAREIQQAAAACAGLAAHARVQIFPLHGELPPEQQDLALRPCPHRKLILSTNLAETSVTIDGLVAVIDGGLVRLPAHDPWTGIATLSVAKISRASAIQRAGRAGRTRPGRCLRLYSQADHDRRPEFTPPEVARADLSAALLDLHALTVADPTRFAWFEAPPPAALQAAEALLHRLGAVDPDGRVTPRGQRMLRFPLHPRLARLVVDGQDRGVTALACGAAALLGERGVRPGNHQAHTDADADVLVDLAEIDAMRRRGQADDTPRGGLLPGPARRVLQVRDQLLRLCDRPDREDMSETTGPERQVAKNMSQAPAEAARPTGPARAEPRPRTADPTQPARAEPRPPATLLAREDALRRALLAAFSDRVALARTDSSGGRVLALADGGAARLSPASVVRSAPWLLALSVEQRQEGLRGTQVLVRSACAIEPDWLLDDFTDEIVASDQLSFNPQRERVEGRSELRYHGLLIDSTPHRKLPPGASQILRDAALAAGPARFVGEPEALSELFARTAFVAAHVPGFPALDEAAARDALAELCDGRSSFAELRSADLMSTLLARVAGHNNALARLAPSHLQLPGGRRLAVHYEPGKPPWVASRLQDFFGLARGPSVADGRVPVVLHLLAPNGRAEQVTTDLAGFWDRHYPDLRRSLMRRYPRHPWPEDPRSAAPPAPRR
ncbi:ATP-dependent helicase C-terminal domain-containing protein [Nannocystis sp.]|uniref:ATP-dependent RNA helicase n=1 Tax=Nannocystis sp. TaxID=1962667 RepID=UPI0025DE6A31|nr:ATP-dependent helicase C-terminal domain-containing protein [Nannocystis sp.]